MTKKKNISENKNNSYLRLIIVLIAIIIIISSLICIFYYNYIVLDYNEFYAEVTLGNTLGLAGGTDELLFGIIPHGSTSIKKIDINYPRDAVVKIKVEGNISKLITVDKNNFFLEANTTETVTFKTIAYENMEYGFYNGTVQFYFLRPSLFG
ncbi:hypothetical protein JW949_00745 [Candidatus Woesearchaeota archaeon]|nr:hypothetical protein [Candidatus Woesearchaeota archaeon]